MSEFVTASESRTVTAHGIFNSIAYFSIESGDIQNVTFTVTPESSENAQANPNLKCEGKVTFATIEKSDIINVNGYDGKAGVIHSDHYKFFRHDSTNYKEAGYAALKVSMNDKGKDENGNDATGNGTTETAGTYTHKRADLKDAPNYTYGAEYVDSQQVSAKDTKEHKVGFAGGLPYIVLPGDESSLNTATNFNQDINLTSKIEGTYKNEPQYITLNVDPNELTYATLNFTNLSLSRYTRLEISAYPSEEDAKDDKNLIGTKTKVFGKLSQNNFSAQIPLSAGTYSTMCLKVELVSKGQIESPSSTGYTIKDITGVYKNKKSGNNDVKEVLKGAKMEWKIVTPVYSAEQVLDSETISKLNKADDVNLTGKDVVVDKEIAKVTYKVPVFPYTGNAVITTYDKNNEVIAYYACPTINGADLDVNKVVDDNDDTKTKVNLNVLSQKIDSGKNISKPYTYSEDGAYFVYRISEEEAKNASVGSILADETHDDFVAVNSEKAGVTCLEGTITGVDGLDATNEKVYTSVQWNAVEPRDAENGAAITLAGQVAKLTAQLVDKNGNAVTTAGKEVSFTYTPNGHSVSIISNGQLLETEKFYGTQASNVTAQALSVIGKTDSKGQAEITLTAAKKDAVLVGIKADNKDYDVVLKANGKAYDKLDVYWIEAGPAFKPTAVENDPKGMGDGTEFKYRTASVVTGACEPTIGETWMYGFTTATEKLPGAGVLSGASVSVNNAKITVTNDSASKGTVLPSEVNGAVIANSKEPGVTTLSAIVDGTPVANTGITFTIGKTTYENIGTGTTSFENQQDLAITWKSEGINGEFVNVNGVNAVTSEGITLYFKVQDKLGNPERNTPVRISSSISGAPLQITACTTSAAVSSAAVVTTETISETSTKEYYANKDGIIAINVVSDAALRKDADLKEIINVSLNKVDYPAYVNWKATPAQAVTLDAATVKGVTGDSIATETDPYRTYADDEKIVLTFTKDILASSVKADQFEVRRANDEGKFTAQDVCKIASVSVSGKTVTIKLKNKITDGKDRNFQVNITEKTIDSVTYKVTTAKTGEQINNVFFQIGSATSVSAPAVVSGFTTAS